MFDPGFVTQHENRRSAGLVIRGLHHAAQQGRHAEEFEGSGSDEVSIEALGAFVRAVEYVDGRIADDAVENVILVHVIEELGGAEGGAPILLVLFCVVDQDGHVALRVRVGERLHQNIFDYAEDGGGGADAESQRQDCNESEARGFS